MQRIWMCMMAACAMSGLVGIGQRTLAGQEAGGTPPTVQQARPARGRVERELERMRETLKLTDDQIAQIRPILENRNQTLKDLRGNSAMPQGEARAKAAQIRRSARKQIERILTPQQRQMQKAMRRGTH